MADESGVYTTHLRDETEQLVGSVQETIKVARETGVKTVISHLRPIKGYENEFDESLKLLEKSAAKASVCFDTSPHSTSVQAIYTLLPQSLQKMNLETMLEAIRDKRMTNLIKKDWQKLDIKGIQVASAPHHPYLVGRAIEDADDLIGIMTATGLRATVSIPNVSEEYLAHALTMSQAFIASNGNSSINTFPKYLEMTVRSGVLQIERAIKKITSDAASYFGVKNRGVIKERNIADLVIIGKSYYRVRITILGGKVVGEEETRSEGLRHKK